MARVGVADIRHWRSTKHQEVDYFLRLSPKAQSWVVASDVDRSFQRELLPGVTVRYVSLEGLLQELAAP